MAARSAHWKWVTHPYWVDYVAVETGGWRRGVAVGVSRANAGTLLLVLRQPGRSGEVPTVGVGVIDIDYEWVREEEVRVLQFGAQGQPTSTQPASPPHQPPPAQPPRPPVEQPSWEPRNAPIPSPFKL